MNILTNTEGKSLIQREKLSDVVKDCREKWTVSQTEFAKKIGISRTTLQRLEKEEIKPDENLQEKIRQVIADYEAINSVVMLGDAIKISREKWGYSQAEFSQKANISTKTLRRLEKGQVIASEEVKTKVLDTIAEIDRHRGLESIFDYVRVSFKTVDKCFFFETILQMSEVYFEQTVTRQFGYAESYRIDMIKVLRADAAGEERDLGMLLELSGSGCRQFEAVLEAQDRSWIEFFRTCKENGGQFTRVDVAINDYEEYLEIPELVTKVLKQEIVSDMEVYELHTSGKFSNEEKTGCTLYLGSKSSDMYFCFYQKNYEQAKKKNIAVEDVDIINRYEIRVMNEKAESLIEKFCEMNNMGELVMGLISGKIRFIDQRGDTRRWDCPTNEKWRKFIGLADSVRLETKPRNNFYANTVNWIKNVVSGQLQVIEAVSQINGTDDFDQAIHFMNLSDHHKHVIEIQTGKPLDWVI